MSQVRAIRAATSGRCNAPANASQVGNFARRSGVEEGAAVVIGAACAVSVAKIGRRNRQRQYAGAYALRKHGFQFPVPVRPLVAPRGAQRMAKMLRDRPCRRHMRVCHSQRPRFLIPARCLARRPFDDFVNQWHGFRECADAVAHVFAPHIGLRIAKAEPAGSCAGLFAAGSHAHE